MIWVGDAVPTQATTANASAASPFGTPTPVDVAGPGGLVAAGNDAGNAVAIWRATPGGGEFPPSIAVRGPAGAFGAPTGLPSDPVSQAAAGIGAGGLGAVAWSEQENDPTPPTCAEGTLSVLASQTPFGTTTQPSDEAYNATNPGIAVAPDGTVLVGWRAANCQAMADNVRGMMAKLGSGSVHEFFYGTGTANSASGFAAAFDCSGNALAVWAQGSPTATIRGARYTAVSPPGCVPGDGGGGDGGGGGGSGGGGGGGSGGGTADDPACENAQDKLDKAKDKLKKLRQQDAAKTKIKKAKKKVKKAKEAVEDDC